MYVPWILGIILGLHGHNSMELMWRCHWNDAECVGRWVFSNIMFFFQLGEWLEFSQIDVLVSFGTFWNHLGIWSLEAVTSQFGSLLKSCDHESNHLVAICRHTWYFTLPGYLDCGHTLPIFIIFFHTSKLGTHVEAVSLWASPNIKPDELDKVDELEWVGGDTGIPLYNISMYIYIYIIYIYIIWYNIYIYMHYITCMYIYIHIRILHNHYTILISILYNSLLRTCESQDSIASLGPSQAPATLEAEDVRDEKATNDDGTTGHCGHGSGWNRRWWRWFQINHPCLNPYEFIAGRWCGCHVCIFLHILGRTIIPTDELIFFPEGWRKTTHQMVYFVVGRIGMI